LSHLDLGFHAKVFLKIHCTNVREDDGDDDHHLYDHGRDHRHPHLCNLILLSLFDHEALTFNETVIRRRSS
jgi:hypothetical protein